MDRCPDRIASWLQMRHQISKSASHTWKSKWVNLHKLPFCIPVVTMIMSYIDVIFLPELSNHTGVLLLLVCSWVVRQHMFSFHRFLAIRNKYDMRIYSLHSFTVYNLTIVHCKTGVLLLLLIIVIIKELEGDFCFSLDS